MSDRDKIAEIIRTSRINASPMSQLGYPEADALIKHGVMLPPCKVGDMVYTIAHNEIKEMEVVNWEARHNFGFSYWAVGKSYAMLFHTRNIGENLFLTREEAEKKLEELRK